MSSSAVQRIDQLINKWSIWDKYEEYYLTELIPGIISGKVNGELDSEEKLIFADLKKLLSDDEWGQLPSLIRQRRANESVKIKSDQDREEVLRQLELEIAKKNQERWEAQLRRQMELEEERIRLELEIVRKDQEKREDEKRKQLELEQERVRQKQLMEQKQRELMLIAQKEKEARDQFTKKIEERLEADFLSVDDYYAQHPDINLITKAGLQQIKTRFVQNWARRKLHLSVDDEQAEAISATSGDIQVIARAGSGKTRTLVTRAVFLQQHCHVSPDELLLLAFNGPAVEEIQKRIKTETGGSPHVMTFHALAHAIVHPDEELIYDDTSASQLKLSREIQSVIDEHILSAKHHNLIRNIMLMHFREDWEKIIKGKHFLGIEEQRKLPHESLNGDFVKSFGEKTIANILFENSVDYKYERNYRWDGINYRPDFTILLKNNNGIIIEYFGLQGDHDYDEMSERKREFWGSKIDWKFFEYSPSDIVQSGVNGFERRLISDLNELGVPTRKRSDEEVWDLIQQRAIDRFTTAIRSFVGRCRKLNLSPSELEYKVQSHIVLSDAEMNFLIAAISIYRGYLQKLEANKRDDFDGLMWRAIDLVKTGQSRFTRNKGQEQGDLTKLRFILIDEFQDFSEMFYQLSMAIRKQNNAVRFFCVGDDWQAINEFAGSELRFFHDFSKYFIKPYIFYISGNYRSPDSVVQVGNALMHGLGKPAVSKKRSFGDVLLCPLDELNLSTIEHSVHNGDEITPAILRLIKYYINLGRKITLLSRRNGLPWFVNYSNNPGNTSDPLQKFREHLASFFPEEDRKFIQISSTHKFKGNEYPIIIVLDAVERSYPLIHPNWIFLRIFGESIPNIKSAERRLFYVALTRPEESLLIITEKSQTSPYLKDIEGHIPLKRIDWAKFPPPLSLSADSERIEVQVHCSYEVKDDLKKLGYRWNSSGKYWSRSFPSEGFVRESFLQQQWINNIVEIKIFAETQDLIFESYPKDRQ